jgi:hypothetical protein
VWLPADGFEIANTGARDLMAFGTEEFPFQVQVGVTAEGAAGGNDPMTRDGWVAALAHDRTHGAPRARRSGDSAMSP